MGIWEITTDELAASRFTVSPLAETVGALMTLTGRRPASPGMSEWADAHRPAFEQRLAADPFAAAFVAAALRPRWVAGLLSIPPQRGDRSFGDELRRVRGTPPERARHDLGIGGHLAPELRDDQVAQRAAELLEWVWTYSVRPDWPRRRRILEADIISRTQRLASGGWAAAVARMRDGMSWLGNGHLQINAYDNPPRTLIDAELMFIPVTAASGWTGWVEPVRYAIIYPCAGLLADLPHDSPPQPLSKLLGPLRAEILMAVGEPRSTSQLVALTGRTLGSIGAHLKILLGAGLIARRRTGRSVLYYRTALGEALTSGSEPRPPASSAAKAPNLKTINPATNCARSPKPKPLQRLPRP